MVFAAVVFLGLISFARLPIDLLPDIAYPKLVIYTTYPDVGPAEVERFVTEPIERQLGAVPGIERVESVSREGVSLVTLYFAWGTDMDFAVLNVRERLDNIRDVLPELASRPSVLRTDPTSEPIMALSVAGSDDLWALKDLTESVFKRRFEQVDGIAQAVVTGGLEREIHVEVEPRLLESYGLTITDVEVAVQAANQSAPGGTIRRGRYQYPLRTLGEFQAVEQIGDVVVGRRQSGMANVDGSGGFIRVRDIARVTDGFKERDAVARYNGRESVGILLFKESGANTVRVTESVEEVIEQLRAEYPAVELDVAMSQAGFISDAISNVVDALIGGAILAFLVLFLFLRDPRYPIAVSLAIPISVIATFALMDAMGVSLNIMSLGGLALGVGMLVDNSIVVLENIFRRRTGGPGFPALGPMDAAAVGAEEVQGAITASTLTTVAVFLPIIYVEGVAGELFGSLSLTVTFSLLASLVVAVMLLPVLAARWAADGSERQRGRVARLAAWAGRPVGRFLSGLFSRPLAAFDRVYERAAERYVVVLSRALDRRGRVVTIAVLGLVGAMALGFALERAVLPDVDQGAFQIHLTLPRGTPLEQTVEAATRLESAVRADPGVSAVFARIGRQNAVAGVEDEESGLNTALLEVRLGDGVATPDVLRRLDPVFAGYPPGTLAVQTGQATALGRLLGGGEADLAVRVRGDDLDRALDYARTLESRLAEIPTLTNVRLGMELGQPEIRVEIDRERAAAFGVEARAVAQTVEAYMRGRHATDFVDFDRKIPVIVRLPDEARRDLETLNVLRVNGVPLRELVRTETAVGPAEVRRLDQARTIPVYADVASGGLDAAIQQVEATLAANPAPRGLRVEIGGESEEMRRSFRNLAFAFALAVVLVYMILAAQFESFMHPFTIMLSVPLAVIGALAALWITGAGLNTMSLIGMVILVGIAVNNAIVMVDFIHQDRRRGLDRRDAILRAGRARLRPILMTTATTVLGLLPMALGIGRGADLRAPLAIAVIGGLISATALTLIVVPVAFDLLESARQRLRELTGLATEPSHATVGSTSPMESVHAPAYAGSSAPPIDPSELASGEP